MVAARPIPKKLSELGRLRIGDREPNKSGTGTHAHKLTDFRMTSPNGSLLGFAAQLYGGTVEPWDDDWAPKDEHGRPTQYELYTTSNALDVLIPTFSAISVSFERWSASGCQQRCTGTEILDCPLKEALIGQPCTCPEDDRERAALAQEGKACARILRLNVLLPDLPGAGVWRLETKGHYATAELLATLDMLQMAGQEHQIIEAVLRLEQRQVKRPGKGDGKGTLNFAVPVIWPKYTSRQILTGAANVLLTAATSSPDDVRPMLEGKTVEQHVIDLYGDPHPAGPEAIGTIARLEALVLAQQGSLDKLYTRAEQTLQKPRTAFTHADYTLLLEQVETVVARQAAQKTTEEGAKEGTGTANAPEAQSQARASAAWRTDDPGASGSPEERPNLFKLEEDEMGS